MSRIVRRVRQAGVYFVTSDTWQRRQLFSKQETAQILAEQILNCRERGFYKLHAFVIMPEHFHALLTPSAGASLEKAMQMIKGASAYGIKRELGYRWPVWQTGFHDRWIRDRGEYETRVGYIHANPVTAKIVQRSDEYPWSSASGRFPLDRSQFEDSTSGAKAQEPVRANVAPEGATYKP